MRNAWREELPWHLLGKRVLRSSFMWFCSALIVNVFGLPFYFPSNIAPTNEIMLYRGETTRVASASLLALLVFRYLFELKALPSLSVVLYYGVFFVIGGIILGIRDNIEVEDMYFLGGIVVLCGLIKLELMQKKKEVIGTFRRDYF